MERIYIISEEKKDLFYSNTKMFSDLPRVISILNRRTDGYKLIIKGTETDLELYIERLQSIGVI